ncbi:ATP-binding protein [Bradyrhizobium canariense]|uniref:ATP-binding protein n=1 Tax=Bradyrhizobium canariense TaxID=255045 RepID=UPI001FCD4F93|nr:ATP-binding protein [Bradyrhizobium canariense]
MRATSGRQTARAVEDKAAARRRTRLLPLEPEASHLSFQLVSRRYETGATLITLNRSVAEWAPRSPIPWSPLRSSTDSCTTGTC